MENTNSNETKFRLGEFKTEIQRELGEVITGGIKNISNILIATFFGNSEITAPQSKIEEVSSTPAYPENLLAIISGHLYMSLKNAGYPTADLRGIMQKVELSVNTHTPDEAINAYKKCEKELLPVMVVGIVVPQEYEELGICELAFSNSRMCARLTNALRRSKITYIKDFRDNDVDVSKIRNIGKRSLEQFKEALSRTINDAANEIAEGEESPVAPTVAVGFQIGGITIPKNKLDIRIDSLTYTSSVSRTKTLNNLKKYNIVRLKDFFNENTPALYKIFSYRGKLSFLETLRRSI